MEDGPVSAPGLKFLLEPLLPILIQVQLNSTSSRNSSNNAVLLLETNTHYTIFYNEKIDDDAQ